MFNADEVFTIAVTGRRLSTLTLRDKYAHLLG